jgi:hypothetical protein
MLVMISNPLPLAEPLETGVAIMVATRDAELRAARYRGDVLGPWRPEYQFPVDRPAG